MDTELRLTVITPVLNSEDFIGRCIENVIEQDCRGVEHLILDGASTDRTLEIIREYERRHSHIRCISERDGGQSEAMNKGIRLARAPVVGFLNVDDYYEPRTLKRALEIFEGLPEPSFIAGNCNIWSDSEGALRLVGVNRPRKLGFKDLLLGTKVNPHPFNPSAYFYHKSLHDRAGPYEVDDPYVMDVDFIFRAAKQIKLRYYDELWGNYRMLRGTKTFERVRHTSQVPTTGLNSEEQIRDKHINALPPWQRRWLKLHAKVANLEERALRKAKRVFKHAFSHAH